MDKEVSRGHLTLLLPIIASVIFKLAASGTEQLCLLLITWDGIENLL